MKKFPALISIPHGSQVIPIELKNIISIEEKDIFEDTDSFTPEIYNVSNEVIEFMKAEVARTFVDLNRNKNDLPPKFPDGVIKNSTCTGKIIYKEQPNKELTEILLKKYYFPYHDSIKLALNNPQLEIAFDCHSMFSVGPKISPDSGKKRPKICLGNSNGKTSNNETIKKLSNCFMIAFELRENQVLINKPFSGGYITKKYGNKPIPWIQIEISKELYLEDKWFDKNNLQINKKRLLELNKKFKKTLEIFFNS